jgi:hypothetical protein
LVEGIPFSGEDTEVSVLIIMLLPPQGLVRAFLLLEGWRNSPESI